MWQFIRFLRNHFHKLMLKVIVTLTEIASGGS
jgi:hypothetical protein